MILNDFNDFKWCPKSWNPGKDVEIDEKLIKLIKLTNFLSFLVKRLKSNLILTF